MDLAETTAPRQEALVERYADAVIPTDEGPLQVIVFREAVGAGEPAEHVALVVGDPLANPNDVLVRVHSECITSEVFGSLKCDCRAQLDAALARARTERGGIVVYLRQEGRGIGLGNKIRAYALQSSGLDTIDANEQLGFDADLRSYDIAGGILDALGVRGVSLMTNNPAKIEGLESCGIRVNRRVPIEIAPTQHSEDYLATKRSRFGHFLDLVITPDEP